MGGIARRTFADYKNLAKHALGGGSPDALVDLDAVINDALAHLQSVHNWKFLQNASVSLTLINQQPYVDLPADFENVTSVTYPETWTNGMIPTTLDELDRLRDAPVSTWTLGFWFAVRTGVVDPSSRTRGMLPDRLELYPTPTNNPSSGNIDGPISIRYTRRFIPLVDDDDVPGFPRWMESAFTHLVRAHIQALEDDLPFADASPAYQVFLSQLNDLMARDGMTQINLGQIVGGIDERYGRPDQYQPESIPDPS